MAEHPTTVGIDVGKDYLDVATLPTGEAYRVTNDASGHAELGPVSTTVGPMW